MGQQAESRAFGSGMRGVYGAILIGVGVVIGGALLGLLLRGASTGRSGADVASAPQGSVSAASPREDAADASRAAEAGGAAGPERTDRPGGAGSSAAPTAVPGESPGDEPSELLRMMERDRNIRAEAAAAIPSSGPDDASAASGGGGYPGASGAGHPGPGSSGASPSSAAPSGGRSSAATRNTASTAPRSAPAPRPVPATSQAVNQVPASQAQRTVTPPPATTPSIPDDPESDRRPPTLVGLQFDPPEVLDGNPATVIVTMSDDIAGVRNVTGNLRSPSGAAILPFQALGDPGGTTFTARIPIPSKAESGTWFVANIFATDRADNTLIASFSAANVPAGGTLRVSSSESDSTAPEVISIYLDRPVIGDGERNTIKMEVTDDRSGVASVTGSFQSPSRAALIPFLCRLNPDSNLWEGDILLPRNADCGEWTIRQVRVADTAGNLAYITNESPVAARATFDVESQERCDSVPPTLDSIMISPPSLSNDAATEVTISVTLHDEGSGPLSITGWVSGPVATNGQAPRIFFSCSQPQNDPGGAWTGRFTVPQFAAKGTWKVGLIRLLDKAHNARDYQGDDPMLAPATFTVD